MNNVVEKDFHIFRGTYEECKYEEANNLVKNMTMYLAWDTHELFFGNSYGKLVPYGVNKTILTKIENELKRIYEELNVNFNNKIETDLKVIVDSKLEEIINSVSDKVLSGFDSKINDAILDKESELRNTLDILKVNFNNLSVKNTNEHTSFQDQVDTLNSDIDALENKIEKFNSDNENNHTKLQRQIDSNLNEIKRISETNIDAVNRVESAEKKITEEIRNVEQEHEKIKERFSVEIANAVNFYITEDNKIKAKLDSEINSIKEKIEDFTVRTEETVNTIVGKYDEDIASLNDNLKTIENNVNENSNSIQLISNRVGVLESFDIESQVNSLKETTISLENDVSLINSSIENINDTIDILNNTDNKLITKTNLIESDIGLIEANINKIISEDLENMETKIDSLEEKNSEIESSIDELGNEIQNQIDTLKGDIEKDITEVEEKIESAVNSALIYMTGNEIWEKESNGVFSDTEKNKLIFCTETSNNLGRKFLLGNIYFVNGSTVETVESKIEINANSMNLNVSDGTTWWNGSTRNQITNANPFTVKPVINFNGDQNVLTDTEPFSTAIKTFNIEYNGVNLSKNYERIDPNNSKIMANDITIDPKESGKHTIKIDIRTKSKSISDPTDYYINNNSTLFNIEKSIEYYQPYLIEVRNQDDSLYGSKRITGTSESIGEETIIVECAANTIIYFYVKDQNLMEEDSLGYLQQDGYKCTGLKFEGEKEKDINELTVKYRCYTNKVNSLSPGTTSLKFSYKRS